MRYNPPMPLHARLAEIDIGDAHPVRIAGVINVSPESFHAGSVARDGDDLVERARAMEAAGADFLDVGAMSTAPYKQAYVEENEERRRMEWAVGLLAPAVKIPLSVDTQRASVAAAALAAGARILNDVSGLRADPKMADVAAAFDGAILMANEFGPSDEEPLAMIERLLGECLERADRAGLARESIVLDPGIGFFRRARLPWHELDVLVLRALRRLHRCGRPLLIGVSRKSFIGRLTGRSEVEDRLAGSLAAAVVAVLNGAHVVRAHDVAATRDAVHVAAALR